MKPNQFILLLAPSLPLAKHLKGSISLNSDNTEKFISKFSFTANTSGKLEGTFTGHGVRFEDSGNNRHTLTLAIFDDVDHEKYLASLSKGSLCEERLKLATFTSILKSHTPSTAEFAVDQVFKPKTNSHFYFFVLADCSLEFYPAHPPSLDYTWHILNGSSELPADQEGMLSFNFFATVLLGLWVFFALVGVQSQLKKFGMVHLSTASIAVALILQFLAVFFEMVHLMKFKLDGKGYRLRHGRLPLDFFSDTCQNLSEAICIVVVVAVANGWLLVDGRFRHISKVAAAAFGIFVFQFFVELHSRNLEDDFSSFHDHDHWTGVLLMLMRVGCCGGMLYGVKNTLRLCQNDDRVIKFLMQFAGFASVWMLTLPVTVFFVAPWFEPHQQHCVVEVCSVLCQGFCMGGLLGLFLGVGEGGKAFFKASTIKDMGDLNTGGMGAVLGGGGGGGGGGERTRSTRL